jgi:hypothetical protein
MSRQDITARKTSILIVLSLGLFLAKSCAVERHNVTREVTPAF